MYLNNIATNIMLTKLARPMKPKPTLKRRMPPFAPKSLAKIVGINTKCPPSQLYDIHVNIKYITF